MRGGCPGGFVAPMASGWLLYLVEDPDKKLNANYCELVVAERISRG